MKYAVCAQCGVRVENCDKKTFICKNCGEKKIVLTNDIKAYYGFFSDTKELKKSSSGGAATVLASSFISNTGGWCSALGGTKTLRVQNIQLLRIKAK